MSQHSKNGIILMNLGSPDSTKIKDVTRYLHEFLMDGKVIDMPYLLRFLLVKGIIVPARVKNSAAAYRTIWSEEGSPLIAITKKLQEAVATATGKPVTIAMRYGNPNPQDAYEKLIQMNPEMEEAILVPLYPHYAMSSYETAVDYMKEIHKKNKYRFQLKIIKPYYNHPEYINALAESIKPYISEPYDKIVFSYHGIPERHLRHTDPGKNHCLQSADCCSKNSPAHAYCYKHQLITTTRLVTQQLGLTPDKFEISFQSRLGKGWLKPFTDKRLEALPREGIKNVVIVCPAFVSDCLETLEEIEERGKESFLQAGGEKFKMVPCLNVSPLWVQAISKWTKEIENGNTALLLS